MTPGVFRIVADHKKLEEQIERQMGCMTGFLQLFDRHQILAGKHFYSTKRLPSLSTAGSSSPSERSEISTMSFAKEAPLFPSSPSPEGCPSSPENYLRTKSPRRHTLPLPVIELKDGLKTSWKLREAPRLSLDSRASVDAKGKLRPREIQTKPVVFSANLSEGSEDGQNLEKQRRSPSVVARLMGLEVLPVSCSGEPPKKSELRRSASEPRVHRDTILFNFKDSSPKPWEEVFGPSHDCFGTRSRGTKSEAHRSPPVLLQRKSSFHSQELFPEPKRVGSLYGEIEKRLRMRGIEETAKDLETMKQILEALQLKGLLHSKPPEHYDGTRLNVANDRRPRTSSAGHSPIVVMKPVPKPPPRLAGSQHSTSPPRSIHPHRPQVPDSIPQPRAQRDRNLQNLPHQRPRSPEPSLASRSSSPCGTSARRRPLNAEGQRTPLPQRRIPAINSPKPSPKKLASSSVGAPKKWRSTVDIPPKDNILPAENDTTAERAGTEYRSGRSLLERCDKLLHSIAAITSSAEQVTSTDRQPSPVSVLDSTFLSDEGIASLIPKRAIKFNDQLTDWDEDQWSHHSSTAGPNSSPGSLVPDKADDYAYVADVIRESSLNRNAADAFAAIENRHLSAAASPLHRRLIFDAVTELVDRKRHLLPWGDFCRGVTAASRGTSLTREVWGELHRIQEHVAAEDVMEAARAVIVKDLATAADEEQGWGVLPAAEMSCAVLHIERQVFKDLVADTIRELADIAGRCWRTASRRRLLF